MLKFYGADASKSEFFGRLINEAAFARLKQCLDKDAPFIVHGGGNTGGGGGGGVSAADKFITPTLLDFGRDMHAFAGSESMSDELFGPLTPIFRYASLEDEVLPFIRAAEKPLALYCFTADGAVADRVLRATSSGGAIINDVVVHLANPQLPFGGVGASGMGSYHGHESFACFSHRKAVVKRVTKLDQALRYPPYSAASQKKMMKVFTPALHYYYAEAADAVRDKKNLAIGALGLALAGTLLKLKPKL